MKAKLLLAAAIALVSGTTYATTARLTALGTPVQVIDIQNVFMRPTDMLLIPESMAIEFGTAKAFGAAQGGFVKGMGDARIGFFVGYGDVTRPTETANQSFLGVENPFTVSYGMKTADMPWAIALTHSSSDLKTTSQKQAKTTLAGAITVADVTINADLGLGDTGTGIVDSANAANNDTDATYKGGKMSLGAWYPMGDWNIYGNYSSTTEKVEEAAANNVDQTTGVIKVGFVNSTKKDGAEFFYGAAYQITNDKKDVNAAGAVKTDTTEMPVVIGVEADAASWLTLRGSVTQNVLLGGKKTTEMNTIQHNTTVNAGAGIKFNKSSLDMVLSMSNDGTLKSNDIGGSAAFNYLF